MADATSYNDMFDLGIGWYACSLVVSININGYDRLWREVVMRMLCVMREGVSAETSRPLSKLVRSHPVSNTSFFHFSFVLIM